jgi:AcrR family transcriptional regulator
MAASSAESAVIALARERPEMGKVRAARELRERGIDLSPSGVHAIWARHGLASSYARLMLRARRATSGRSALSVSQQALLRRARISRRVSARGAGNGESGSHPRRDELITAAAKTFSARGYERASLRKICADAGILAGSMYHHFRSKEELFISVHAEGFRQLNQAVDRAIADESDPWRRLEAACAAHITALVQGNDVLVVTGTSLFHTSGPALRRRLNRDRSAYEERFRAMVEALPLPRDLDRTILRLALLGAVNWTHIWYRPGKKTPQQIAHQLVAKILKPR